MDNVEHTMACRSFSPSVRDMRFIAAVAALWLEMDEPEGVVRRSTTAEAAGKKRGEDAWRRLSIYVACLRKWAEYICLRAHSMCVKGVKRMSERGPLT
jgi:hypothetical protein